MGSIDGKRNVSKAKAQQPVDILSAMATMHNSFAKAPASTTRQGSFSAGDYGNLRDPVHYKDIQGLEDSNKAMQTGGDMAGNVVKQFGANLVSSVGQGFANTFDLIALGKTAKGEVTGSNDDFTSSLFGLSTRDMQEWANEIAKNNPIYEKKEGDFNLSDPGWWGKQIASAGTGVGMAIEAGLTTAAIEFATGGLGTAGAMAKLGSVVNRLRKGAKGAEVLAEGFQAAKGMKSAATLFGTLSRTSESRMEAMNNYTEIYNDLSSQKNKDGSPKYSEAEAAQLASSGARRDFNINMALLPLDILSFRAMVYNPISGTATGLVERALGKVAGAFGKSKAGKAAGWFATKSIGAQLEGIEEGFQNIGEHEGQHYAQVLGGVDDGSTFLSRAAKQVETDEFWNNYAGGIIGSPIIAGVMNLTQNGSNKRQAAMNAETHADYIRNIGSMDAKAAATIKQLDAEGKTREAAIGRRQLNASKILGALHLDNQTDKDTAFPARMAFIDGVLEELNEGKTTALADLGFTNLTPEHLETIKQEFKDYKEDAEVMQSVYDNVKTKYNRNFVPEIAQSHFELNRLQKEMETVDKDLAMAGSKVTELGMLSPQGKEVHDTEYRIKALEFERERLNEEFKAAENKHEKENINQLITQNNEKLTVANQRIQEINQDETYDKATKDKDADIMGSALLSKEYQQAIYDKEALDNTITLKRKNVALYNNTEYMQNKVKESVKNLKTQKQVDNVKESNKDKAVAEELAKREAAIQAANVAQNEPGIQNEGLPIGDSEVMAEDNDAIATIANIALAQQGQPPVQQVDPNDPSLIVTEHGAIEQFAPATIDFSKTSDAAKEQLRNAVKGMQDRLGPNSSFEDLTRHVVKLKGVKAADEMFNALKYGWETNGNSVVDYEKVYQSIFGDPTDAFVNAFSQLVLQNKEELEVANDTVLNDVAAHEENKPEFDNNNQPVYKYEDLSGRKQYVTNESSPKAAYVTRLSKEIRTVDENGNIVISHEYIDEALNEATDVDSLQLLDPDSFTAGTETEIRVPSNFLAIKIRTYNPDGSPGKVMTFGQYVAENGLTPTDQKYKDSLPMIHYKKGAAKDAKGLFFVHDIGWYHPERFNVAFPDDMKKAIDSTRAIREEVVADDAQGKATPATITGKRQTTFKGLKTGGELITLREANPDTQLTLVLDGVLKTSKKLVAYPNDSTHLVNTEPLVENQIMDVRRYGLKNGIKTFLASFVIRPKITMAAKESVTQAITIYANSLNPNLSPDVKVKHDTVAAEIKKSMGLDIKSAKGLEDYLQHFIVINRVEGANGKDANEVAARQLAGKLKRGTPYMTFLATGQLVFGQAGIPVKQYVDTKKRDQLMSQGMSKIDADKGATVTTWNYFINPNSHAYISEGLKQLNRKITVEQNKVPTSMNTLDWYETNLDLDNLNVEKKVPVITIKSDGSTAQAAPSYRDYLLDNLQTNLRSHNIGTTEKPNYVTNIQPIITYDTNKRLAEQNTQPTMSEVASEVVEQKTEVSQDSTVQELLAPHENSPVFAGMTTTEQKLKFLAEQALNMSEGKPVVGGTDNYLAMVDKYGDKLITKAIDLYEKGALTEVTPITPKTTPVSHEVQAFLDKMKGKLGGNFGVTNDGGWASPAALTQEQRDAQAKSLIKIAGLLPHQQSQVVDFIFNQIVPQLKINKGTITTKEVTAIIDDAVDKVFAPLEAEYKSDMAYANALLEQFPEMRGENSDLENTVAGLQMRISKIHAVTENLPKLQELAMEKVDKYTNIKSKTVKQTDLDAERQDDGTRQGENDSSAEESRDFWTDILQENPEHKATYEMRRFFGQMRMVDKDGKHLQGFLNLPLYIESSVVIRELMTTLADVPSDFNKMIAALEKRQEGIPWMAEVIDRLKTTDEQMKNTFVTVMSNTPLRMKFTMLSYNRKTGAWSTKVYDTNQSGVVAGIKGMWNANLFDTKHDLITLNEEGGYTLNKAKALHLINVFDMWKGKSLYEVQNIENMRNVVQGQVKVGQNAIFTPVGALAQELKTNLVGKGDRVQFSMSNKEFQITALEGGKYEVGLLQKNNPTEEDISRWLGEFGIVLSPQALKELMDKGLYHNYGQRTFDALFEGGEGKANTNGLFGILSNHLRGLINKEDFDFSENGDNPLDNSVVGSLAILEGKYNTSFTPFGFRDNGKSFFGLTAPKFVTDRVRDLKSDDATVRGQLNAISFSKSSLWLRLLEDPEFKAKFGVVTIGETAIKEQGSKRKIDSNLAKLADADHELTKLGMFWDMLQGSVSYNTKDAQGNAITIDKFPGSSVVLRMATIFSLTYSDKHINTPITTAVLNFENSHLMNGEGITDEVAHIIYDQTIKPELLRMLKFVENGKKSNVKNYAKGAGMFLLMPEMNNIEIYPGVKLVDAINDPSGKFNLQQIEANEGLMKNINMMVKDYVRTLSEEKEQVWKNNGYVTEEIDTVDGAEVSTIKDIKFIDNKYISKFKGSKEQQLKMATMDYVINSMIANANSFMTLAGDPALYFKEDKRKDADGNVRPNTTMEKVQDTFTNAGKRLANQIAPGTTLSNSEGEKYLQIFLEDRVSTAANITYLKELFGEGSKPYTEIEGSDAQEYTTWKEWLDILTKMGKTPDGQTDVTPEEIKAARELFSSSKTKAQMTERDREILNKVAQPLKPVYTGQIFDPTQDMMRTVYIKSSSFPLIPQMTEGLEIDKLRQKMEDIQSDRQLNVRVSYQSANKVGSMNNAVRIWNDDGTVDQGALNQLSVNDPQFNPSLVLDRKNFRIQQEVPFKSGKQGEDKITLGTQLMKLLFGDGVMDLDGFTYEGKPKTGRELREMYNKAFISLVTEKTNQLFNELGLDNQGKPIDEQKTMAKLQELLQNEAIKRDYPLQDIQGLNLVEIRDATKKVIGSEFNLPLWASSNSNRYESMLNSIVTNRLIKMKFPGNSFVVGSPEGFVKQDTLEGVDKSMMIYTPAWNGKELTGTQNPDGSIKKAQVFIASKFKDNDGNLIDLFTPEGTGFKYITKTAKGYELKTDMFSEELLSLLSFRIPTSGHQSASQVEIAGFLPHMNGDLMIVPSNFTKQKGLDFDVDKENSYQFNQIMTADGKFEVLSEKHRTQVLAAADRLKTDSQDATANAFFDSWALDYNAEEIADDKLLTKVNSAFNEKLLQNEIIRIHHSVFSNPSKVMQTKIAKTLNTDFAGEQAEFIDGMISANKDNKFWTPLSDEYQKQKMMSGSVGKIGTGAYSIDVVFHSLAQQAALNGRPIVLNKMVYDAELDKMIPTPVTWRFGIRGTKDGQLGNPMTIDGGRSISEVQAERQNVMVDNEKLQIAGRVGLNELTMDVDKIFNMLGFDKGEDENSISFLFLSQPIIKEYVNRMRNASSNMATYDINKERKIIDALKAKYNPDGTELSEDEASSAMTNTNFITSISQPDAINGQLQAAVLDRFLEMKKFGESLRSIQSTINTDSKGLGKSFFDVIEKREALNRLGSPTSFKDADGKEIGTIIGASGLIGEYEPTNNMTDARRAELLAAGHVDIGQYMVKPDTLTGAFSVKGVMTAYNLWSKHFPYDSPVVRQAINETLQSMGGENINATKKVEMKQDIFRGIRKYLPTSRFAGIIGVNDNINDERASLFIDSATNTSLASYLKELKQMPNNAAVNEFIKTNKLINRFEYHIQKNGMPSVIRFNNAAGEDFDEQYLYESLSVLMEVRGTTGSVQLPKVGNKEYTLDTLAQALIEYCYIANATQEAVQFTKYVPLSYLEQIDYARKLRHVGNSLGSTRSGGDPRVLGLKTDKGENEDHLIGEFSMQYTQHNPEKVKYSFDPSIVMDVNGEGGKYDGNLNSVESFKLNNGDQPIFIKAYNPGAPKGEKKQNLYWFDGTKYVKVPVLGAFGMDEYQRDVTLGIGTSIINGVVKNKATPQPAIRGTVKTTVPTELDALNINGGNISEIVTNVAAANIAGLSEMANALLPFASGVAIKYSDSVVNSQGKTMNNFEGLYTYPENVIYISPKNVQTSDMAKSSRVVIHELVHALTIKQINPYILVSPTNDVTVKANAPSYVSDLVRLYNNMREMSDKGELLEILTRVRNSQLITVEQKNVKYGLTDIYEFMAMAMTQPEFQKYMAKEEFKQSGTTLLDKFKSILSDVFKAIGINFGSDTATASAINSIFDLIQQENAPTEAQNKTDEWLKKMADEMPDDYEPGDNLDALSPNIDLDIDENCY